MKKEINHYVIESKDSKTTIYLKETDNGFTIKVVGEEPEVEVNGITVFSRDKYKLIPENLRKFIRKFQCEWGLDIERDDVETKVDVEIEGRSFLAIIPSDVYKSYEMLLRDWIIEYYTLEDYLSIEVENGKENFEAFKKAVKDLGCEIRFSHGGNDYDNWYDLVVRIDEPISEENIVECVKLWNKYNDDLVAKYLNGKY